MDTEQRHMGVLAIGMYLGFKGTDTQIKRRVYGMVARGMIPYSHLGHALQFDRLAVDKAMEKHTIRCA